MGNGMTKINYDKRLNAYQDNLADIGLKGKVTAKNFVTPDKYQVTTSKALLYGRPDEGSPLTSQLLYGEYFNVFEINKEWAWGQSLKDGYVGYCSLTSLTQDINEITHHVSALSCHIYPEPNLKTAAVHIIHMMSDVSVINEDQVNGFMPLSDGNWIYANHITKKFADNPVTEALKFLNTPYLWGGRSNAGIDCSALIQIAYASTGVSITRDADLQEEEFGTPLNKNQLPRHGDLAFFPGHVGIMLDGINLLHANAHHMKVSINPLKEVIDIVRLQTDKPPLSSFKRP